MAHVLPKYRNAIFTLCMFSFLFGIQSHQFSRKLSTKSLSFKKQKLSHLHFYFHDIPSGDHPTAFRVAEAPITNTSATFFGATIIVDDPLTVGPDLTFKIVGRAQGVYVFASLSENRLVVALNYVFVEGKYNGSSLSILGTNALSAKVREMPIVGGSGLFRFARGYALLKTHSFNASTGYAIVEYDVYVIHY